LRLDTKRDIWFPLSRLKANDYNPASWGHSLPVQSNHLAVRFQKHEVSSQGRVSYLS
jgi:hypothetical protein